jgi:hypothetical protein
VKIAISGQNGIILALLLGEFDCLPKINKCSAILIPFLPDIVISTGQRVLLIWRIDVHKVLQIRKLGVLTALMPCLPSISLWSSHINRFKNYISKKSQIKLFRHLSLMVIGKLFFGPFHLFQENHF